MLHGWSKHRLRYTDSYDQQLAGLRLTYQYHFRVGPGQFYPKLGTQYNRLLDGRADRTLHYTDQPEVTQSLYRRGNSDNYILLGDIWQLLGGVGYRVPIGRMWYHFEVQTLGFNLIREYSRPANAGRYLTTHPAFKRVQ